MLKRLVKILIVISLFLGIFFNAIGIHYSNKRYKIIIDTLKILDNTDRQLTEMTEQLFSLDNKMANAIEQLSMTDLKFASIVGEFMQQSNYAFDKLLSNVSIVDKDRLLNSSVYVQGLTGIGSGTIIKKTKNEMYILTCYHIISDILELWEQNIPIGASVGYLTLDEYNNIESDIAFGAEIIKYSEGIDLALLKVFFTDENLIACKIAEQEPEIGETIYTVGNPLGLFRVFSKGILSNKEDIFYITDNIITFGNSGGSLFNSVGELIGVPANVFVYNITPPIPESSLGRSVNLKTIRDFLEGEV